MFAPTPLPGLENRIDHTFADSKVGIAHNDIKVCNQSLQDVLCSDTLNVFSHLRMHKCTRLSVGAVTALSLFS